MQLNSSNKLQVRAGEGESEAENYVLTNPVAKTSMSSGLSSKGKAQVQTPALLHSLSSHIKDIFSRRLLHLPGSVGLAFTTSFCGSNLETYAVSACHPVQVIKDTMPALKALGACQGSCWLWPSITQVSSFGITCRPCEIALIGAQCGCLSLQSKASPIFLSSVMVTLFSRAALVPDSRDPGSSYGADPLTDCA